MSNHPRFAVVGHPNKGKSSIVSTLVHNDAPVISELSGTTTAAQSYSYRLDGERVYELFDTPGFQRPRQVLSWLQAQGGNASTRASAIEAFIQAYRDKSQVDGRFKDEVELLQPIMHQGAGIIYVVDGSIPYTPEYEAEMTILQWTGQARMALINPIGGEDYVPQWQQALGQYFSVVKVFNPMTADVEKQCSILSAFAELNDDWKHALEQGLHSIRQSDTLRKHQAIHILMDSLDDILSYKVSLPLLSDQQKEATALAVQKKYQHYLRQQEKKLQQRIEVLYAHQRLQCEQEPLDAAYPDLFDQDYWYLFGLSRQKIITLSSSAGAAAGAVLDTSLGGASLFAGTLIGSLVGASASFALTHQPDKVSIKGFSFGGKQMSAGPVKNVSFAFVLLGRNIRHLKAVSQRVHADRSVLNLVNDNDKEGKDSSWIDVLSHTQQLMLTRLLQKSSKGWSHSERKKLSGLLDNLL